MTTATKTHAQIAASLTDQMLDALQGAPASLSCEAWDMLEEMGLTDDQGQATDLGYAVGQCKVVQHGWSSTY